MFLWFSLSCRSYEKPVPPSDEKLQDASRQFATGVFSALKNPSLSAFYVNMQLDVWRYITYKRGTPSQHKGHFIYSKNDFSRFKWLPDTWWYSMSMEKEMQLISPSKLRPFLSWSPAHFIKKGDKLCKASKFPLEKICISLVKLPCNVNNLHVN